MSDEVLELPYFKFILVTIDFDAVGLRPPLYYGGMVDGYPSFGAKKNAVEVDEELGRKVIEQLRRQWRRDCYFMPRDIRYGTKAYFNWLTGDHDGTHGSAQGTGGGEGGGESGDDAVVGGGAQRDPVPLTDPGGAGNAPARQG